MCDVTLPTYESGEWCLDVLEIELSRLSGTEKQISTKVWYNRGDIFYGLGNYSHPIQSTNTALLGL